MKRKALVLALVFPYASSCKSSDSLAPLSAIKTGESSSYYNRPGVVLNRVKELTFAKDEQYLSDFFDMTTLTHCDLMLYQQGRHSRGDASVGAEQSTKKTMTYKEAKLEFAQRYLDEAVAKSSGLPAQTNVLQFNINFANSWDDQFKTPTGEWRVSPEFANLELDTGVPFSKQEIEECQAFPGEIYGSRALPDVDIYERARISSFVYQFGDDAGRTKVESLPFMKISAPAVVFDKYRGGDNLDVPNKYRQFMAGLANKYKPNAVSDRTNKALWGSNRPESTVDFRNESLTAFCSFSKRSDVPEDDFSDVIAHFGFADSDCN